MSQLTIKTEDQRIRLLNEIRKLDTDRLYIWGKGEYSKEVKLFLLSEGGYSGEIIYIIDDSYYREGEEDVLPLSAFVKQTDKETPIVFGFYNYELIQKKRQEWSWCYPNMYDFHFAVVNGERIEWNPMKTKEKEYDYQRTYNMLSDEKSKLVMQLYLNAATAGEFHELFSQCYEKTAYFNRITERTNVDILIDCGAFDGDSIHDFVQAFREYDQILAFEPDHKNVERLREREKKERIRGLQIIQKGVGSCQTELRFQAKGESNSFLDINGDVVIQITTLDGVAETFHLLQANKRILLKMDIEGSELEALHGAERLIRECRPVLAICVYHKEEDLIEIPQFVHRIAGEGVYDYYLGFHGLDLAELVFYAVPKTE